MGRSSKKGKSTSSKQQQNQHENSPKSKSNSSKQSNGSNKHFVQNNEYMEVSSSDYHHLNNEDYVMHNIMHSDLEGFSSPSAHRKPCFGLAMVFALLTVLVASLCLFGPSGTYHPTMGGRRAGGVFVQGETTGTAGSSNDNMMIKNHLSGYPNARIKPSLCPDGVNHGYSDWNVLRAGILEANHYAESLALMEEYNQFGGGVGQRKEWVVDELTGISMPYQPPPSPEPFVICPGITLSQSSYYGYGSYANISYGKKGPIFIDSEDIVIECDGCIVDIGGTHLSFGPNAKGTIVKGITFMGARSSSLIFHHHGAEASFEDCSWIGNSGTGNAGAVADLNSTSSVSFFRCEISDSKQRSKNLSYGGTGGSSSLTIRN